MRGRRDRRMKTVCESRSTGNTGLRTKSLRRICVQWQIRARRCSYTRSDTWCTECRSFARFRPGGSTRVRGSRPRWCRGPRGPGAQGSGTGPGRRGRGSASGRARGTPYRPLRGGRGRPSPQRPLDRDVEHHREVGDQPAGRPVGQAADLVSVEHAARALVGDHRVHVPVADDDLAGIERRPYDLVHVLCLVSGVEHGLGAR